MVRLAVMERGSSGKRTTLGLPNGMNSRKTYFLVHQVHKRGIDVRLNTRATPEMLGDDFDTVVAAVGAEPVVPRIPGVECPHVTVATDAIMHSGRIGKTVVVIGGGEVGVETGMFLAQGGRDVTVVEMRGELAADSAVMHYRSMFKSAWEAIPSFHSVLNATAKEIADDHVTYADADGAEHDILQREPLRNPVDRKRGPAFRTGPDLALKLGWSKRPGSLCQCKHKEPGRLLHQNYPKLTFTVP